MKHTSVKLSSPVEFVNVSPLNPLISKCQIKVCYVGEEPNRNGTVITKEVATNMANSLPGCPIVGFFNDTKEDFEGHNKIIDISDGKFEIKDVTKPYGFVPIDAKVWFQKFMDDGRFEHEYLMTEGYLWVGQFPECERIFTEGNNQSMELDGVSVKGTWSENENGGPEFFIINEAIISKLCILGQDVEPCFEGANITNIQFSFDEGFKNELYAMMNELKELLQEGGAKKVFDTYAVEVGDALWTAIYSHMNGEYSIAGVYKDGEQAFAVLQDSENKFYRMNFSYSESEEFVAEELVDITETYQVSETPQFSADLVNAFIEEFAKKKEDEEKDKEEKEDDSEDKDKTPEKDDSDSEDKEKEEDEEEKKKKKYSLLEEEHANLELKYSELETKYNDLVTENETLNQQLSELNEFKLKVDRTAKEEMIANFYMLTDEDKKDVIDNIDTYSLDQIEAKLSIICVRNKVKFDDDSTPDLTFNLDSNQEDTSMPAWIKAALAVEKNLK